MSQPVARLTQSVRVLPFAVVSVVVAGFPICAAGTGAPLGSVGDADLSWVVLFVFSFLGAVAFLVSRRRR